MNPFDFVNDISKEKKNLISLDAENEKSYNPFLINRAFSYYIDCISYANEMNKYHFLDKKLQHDFLLHAIRSKRRAYSKWEKPNKDKNLSVVAKCFNVSKNKAEEILKLLSDDDINNIKEKYDLDN